MRKPLLIVLLGATAISLSACSSSGSLGTGSGTTVIGGGGGGTGGGGTGTDPDDGNTETTTGGSQVITSTNGIINNGDSSYVFTDADDTGSPLAQTRVTINNQLTGAETALVQVDAKNTGVNLPVAVQMGLYGADTATKNTVYASNDPSDPLKAHVNNLGPSGNFSQDIYSHDPDGQYREYRKIVPGVVDTELQLWNYTNSYVGQYRNWGSMDGSDSNTLVNFYGGEKTDPAVLATSPTATYTGRAGATATASNWEAYTRTIPDPFAVMPSSTFPGLGTGPQDVNPNGEWRMLGDANLTADFASGQVTGRIDNLYWRKYQPDPEGLRSDHDGYITVTPAETQNPFPDRFNLRAAIDADTGDYAGSVTAQGWVIGENGVKGSFFGPGANEATGVFHTQATLPAPTDGLTPNDRNGRGFLDVRGVFQTNRN